VCQLAYSDSSAGGFRPEEPLFQCGEIDNNWKNLLEVSKGSEEVNQQNLCHTCVSDRFEPLRCRSSTWSTHHFYATLPAQPWRKQSSGSATATKKKLVTGAALHSILTYECENWLKDTTNAANGPCILPSRLSGRPAAGLSRACNTRTDLVNRYGGTAAQFYQGNPEALSIMNLRYGQPWMPQLPSRSVAAEERHGLFRRACSTASSAANRCATAPQKITKHPDATVLTSLLPWSTIPAPRTNPQPHGESGA